MSTLLLHLPRGTSGNAVEYSYTLTHDGHTAVQHASVPAALLPDPGRAGEVVAIVPVRALSWHRVVLPQGVGPQAPRLRAVLEGLLEERVLDDPAELHFALQPSARAGAAAWVAVCDRAWLREALQHLEAAGRPASRVVPEFAPGPTATATATATATGASQCTILGTPEDAQLVATAQGDDLSLAVLPLSSAALAWVGALQTAPQHAADPPPVRAEPAVAQAAEQMLGRPVGLHTLSQRALEAGRSDWDLAQFDLASTGRTRALRKAGSLVSQWVRAPQWRAARWALGLAIATQLIGINVWAWQERQALAEKQAGIRSALTQSFPQVQVIVDAPVQMERELAQLRQSTGSLSARDLEPVMAATGAALPPGPLPSVLEYAAGDLRLRGLELSDEDMGALNQRLAASGYGARMQNGVLLVRMESPR